MRARNVFAFILKILDTNVFYLSLFVINPLVLDVCRKLLSTNCHFVEFLAVNLVTRVFVFVRNIESRVYKEVGCWLVGLYQMFIYITIVKKTKIISSGDRGWVWLNLTIYLSYVINGLLHNNKLWFLFFFFQWQFAMFSKILMIFFKRSVTEIGSQEKPEKSTNIVYSIVYSILCDYYNKNSV